VIVNPSSIASFEPTTKVFQRRGPRMDGGGNIDSDPQFVDPLDPIGPDGTWMTDDDGLRLQADSPCIDSGDNPASPNQDILGNFRPFDGDGDEQAIADMGAYEFGSQPQNFVILWDLYP
jgi:hypothetical protein